MRCPSYKILGKYKLVSNIKKIGLAADSCSLIYLYRSDLLRHAARAYQLHISHDIWQELAVKASQHEMQSYSCNTTVTNFATNDVVITTNGLSSADRGLVKLFHHQKLSAILSEDGKILQHCKKNNIPHFCCLSLISELLRFSVLSLKQARMRFDLLKGIGRYTPWVVEKAYAMLIQSNIQK